MSDSTRVPGRRMTPQVNRWDNPAPPRRVAAPADTSSAVTPPAAAPADTAAPVTTPPVETPPAAAVVVHADDPDATGLWVPDDFEDTAERPAVALPPVFERPEASPSPVALPEPDPVALPEPEPEPLPAPALAEPPSASVPVAQPSGIPTAEPKGRGGRAVAALVAGLVLLGGGGYAAGHVLADGKLPKGTSVAGIDIGGQTRSEAEATLRAELTGRSRVPINLTVDGAPQSIAPETAGLGLDITGSVAQARPISGWSPSELWRFWAGGEDLDAALKVDDEQFTGTLDTLAAGVAQPARDGEIRFRGKRIRVVKPQDGRALDVTAAAETLREAYLDEGAVAALETGPATPDIDEADVADALASFAKPAVSAPVTLSFSGQRVTLAPDAFGSALEMVPEAGALVPRVKSKVLTSLLEGKVDNEDAPVDATVRIVDGRPQVIKAQPGVGYAQPTIDEALIKAASGADGSREASVKAGKAKASFTTKDARALKIRRKVSTFTTYYPYAEYRNINIPRAAELVNGTVLKPGETFSLNETVGERTTANGFTTGFIIRNGLFAEDLGGGVSQMATTTYNAAYFAGLEDVEHWPHSFFIDRYPPGREATVAWGSKDLRFKNDTPYGVLIQAGVARATPSSSGVVTVSIWSTKLWDVATSASGRYNLTQPKEQTIIDRDGTCVPNVGYGGFDIDVTRYWRKPGTSEVVKQETDHTTYIPADTVICKQPDAPAP